MPLFQNSVIRKQLQDQDKTKLNLQWKVFKNHFQNLDIQNNIRNSKEEQYQGEFLIDLFVNVFGYIKNPNPNYTLTTEHKNVKDSKKADGAILVNDKVRAVIELKGTNTTDLGKIEVQAFGYKNNQPDCVYVITSNFEKLRFYIDNATEFLEFNLFRLTEKEFELLYLCLAYDNINKDIPKKLKEQSATEEKNITKYLYTDYSLFKRELHQNLVALNPSFDALELFQKSQKLLDRFLFIFFAEDRNLLPTNLIFRINKEWRQLQEMRVNISLYDRYKTYFHDLNQGAKVVLPAFSQTAAHEKEEHQIFAYNGGLFHPDDILDAINIDDELLFSHTQKLSKYDFASEIDVNILGHIFENSLNELDEIKAQLEGTLIEKASTKRKKDGIFYTPKYITKYIVDNTIGKMCTSKKAEFKIIEEDYFTDKKRNIITKKPLFEKLTNYRNWLLQVTICDPACGSGAFLNEALDFLIAEHRYIDELQAKLLGEALVLSDIEKSILENNLFGVDLNEESVEIAKLSLWLRTAKPNRKLNDLNNNIKCGNSLIDDVAIAGEKAFNWQTAFPKIFANGGFDVIIGNPPYGAFITKKEQNFYTKNYNTASYKLDTYAIFIEKGIGITKLNGKLGYIIPYTFLSIQQHRKLREFILGFNIETLVDLPTKVFESADLDTVILLMTKNIPTQIIKSGKIQNQEVVISNEIGLTDILNNQDLQINLNNSSVDITLINKIKDLSFTLNDFCEISQGYIPYRRSDLIKNFGEFEGNRIVDGRLWHSFEKKGDEWKQEIQGQDIGRYTYKESFQYVKYGSHIASYVNPKFFNSSRIIIMEITRGNKYKLSSVYLEKEFYNTPSIINIISRDNSLDLKSILPLINSRLMTWFHLKVNPKANAETSIPKILVGDVRNLPIAKNVISYNIPLAEKADLMLLLNRELQEQSQKFQRILQRKFDLEALPKKLQDWYLLPYADFIKELGKQKIKLTLSQEAEWEDYFTKEAHKLVATKAEINQTDKEIDAMVYKLYDLTDEEIGIVENSMNN
ncbi:restriction endonuclease subunit M [Pedobacter ginsengisoli]|uniref:site-specific DNA-methyltransferase (adenine-specific) n=1 Tax=Pedobacter ginsengisoli TaxID=363852 RepID=A0A2D1U3R0_9SPHI|nr:N-6 DNA methylase [Pedobacter ginsengisoli]ATP56231.1 restriction endonuclease subunit M [Pedobacter ginsengisoli]